jgi:hypothetical protein
MVSREFAVFASFLKNCYRYSTGLHMQYSLEISCSNAQLSLEECQRELVKEVVVVNAGDSP